MRTVLIIQARMGSTRLPGKVLKPLLGLPMLERQVERLRRCELVDQIVVATTKLPADDSIVTVVDKLQGVGLHRGSEADVLGRYLGAANDYGAEVIVRITADCPLIDPDVVDAAIRLHARNQPRVAYVSNVIERTYARGLDVEVFPSGALAVAADEAVVASDREHVTPFIWRQPDRFPQAHLLDVEDNSQLRWTVDTPEDYAFVTRVYEELYPSNPTFDYRAVLSLLRAKPELGLVNQHIEQKMI